MAAFLGWYSSSSPPSPPLQQLFLLFLLPPAPLQQPRSAAEAELSRLAMLACGPQSLKFVEYSNYNTGSRLLVC